MTNVQFDAQVKAALARVNMLRDRADAAADSELARAVLLEAVEELTLAFEELNVSQEELRVQIEALAAAEVAAVAERDRYRDLFEFAPSGYLITDAEGVILETNHAARELVHVTGPRFLVGKPIVTLVTAADRPRLHKQLSDLQRGEPAWHQTLRFQPRPEGSPPRTADVTVVPFRDLETREPRLRWQLRDVTAARPPAGELEKQVGRLQAADRKKDEFLATLAHELRNPLAPIRNAVQILLLRAAEDPVMRQAAEMIDRQAIKLDRLVEDLLDVSRITRGKLALSAEPTDLADAAGRAAEAVAAAAKDRGVKLAVTPPDAPVSAVADPSRLEQVLVNLMTNAVKYTPRGGRVTVCVGQDGDRAVVRVRDTGIGIAPDLLPHVFDLFVQAEHDADSQGGLGIGLHLVKQLVELHGGSVSAHSEGPGHGTEFVISLPAAG
jgi:PAS domain S-box-containing protein